MASKELNVLLPITYYILVSEDTLDVLKQTTLYTKDTNKRIMVLSKSFSSQPSPNDAPPGRGVEHVKDDGLSLLNLLESVCQEPEVVAKWTVFVDKTVYIKEHILQPAFQRLPWQHPLYMGWPQLTDDGRMVCAGGGIVAMSRLMIDKLCNFLHLCTAEENSDPFLALGECIHQIGFECTNLSLITHEHISYHGKANDKMEYSTYPSMIYGIKRKVDLLKAMWMDLKEQLREITESMEGSMVAFWSMEPYLPYLRVQGHDSSINRHKHDETWELLKHGNIYSELLPEAIVKLTPYQATEEEPVRRKAKQFLLKMLHTLDKDESGQFEVDSFYRRIVPSVGVEYKITFEGKEGNSAEVAYYTVSMQRSLGGHHLTGRRDSVDWPAQHVVIVVWMAGAEEIHIFLKRNEHLLQNEESIEIHFIVSEDIPLPNEDLPSGVTLHHSKGSTPLDGLAKHCPVVDSTSILLFTEGGTILTKAFLSNCVMLSVLQHQIYHPIGLSQISDEKCQRATARQPSHNLEDRSINSFCGFGMDFKAVLGSVETIPENFKMSDFVSEMMLRGLHVFRTVEPGLLFC